MKKIVWAVVSCLMVLSLVVASCGGEEGVKEDEDEGVVIPSSDEPQYGGTITMRLGSDITVFDMYWAFLTPLQGIDGLFMYDYTIPEKDYDIYKCLASMDSPTTVGTKSLPWLAESVEQTDPVTWIVHLREGVHWQNKPPVNGREFTAHDVKYHFDRLLGIGSGFTEPSPFAMIVAFLNLESLEVIDNYTIVWKFKKESFTNRDAIMGMGQSIHGYVAPREVIEEYGDGNDWKRVITTGAYILTDYVTESAATYEKNPDYYLNDYRFPGNKLPYSDKLKQLVIPDNSTAIAALRTGEIDLLYPLGWEQSEMLETSNPELEQYYIFDSGGAINFRCNKEPFTDIKVRIACQKAMDLKAIAEDFWGGYPDGNPMGCMGLYAEDFVVRYQEWPQDLKDEFTYDPAAAKELLAEAGYPNGFKVTCMGSLGFGAFDLDLLQVVKAYLLDIGVDMEIQTMDPVSASAWLSEDKDVMNVGGTTGVNWPWIHAFARDYTPNPSNYCNNNDPAFNALYDSASTASTPEELQRLSREMYLYDLEHHWRIYLQPAPRFTVYQPWLKGISGENLHADFLRVFVLHWWVDQDMKEAMGN